MRVQRVAWVIAAGITAAAAQTIYLPFAQSQEYPRAVAADSTGVYVAGEKRPVYYQTYGAHAFIRKFDSEGKEIWARQFETMSAITAAVASGAGVYVAGNTETASYSDHSVRYAFIRRYDQDGMELWTSQFGGAPNNYTFDLAPDSTGVFVLSWSETGAGSNQVENWVLRRFDTAGQELWSLPYPYCGRMSADETGVYLPGRESAGCSVRKYSRAGVQLWSRAQPVGSPGGSLAANSHGFYATGVTQSLQGGPYERVVHAFDDGGNPVWTRTFPADVDEILYQSAMTADDRGFYLAASMFGTLEGQCRSGYRDLKVSRFDTVGNLVWTRQLGTDQEDSPATITAAAGKIFVSGGYPGAPVEFVAAVEQDPPGPSDTPRILNECVVNAANFVGGALAPGEIVTILGSSLGPAAGMTAQMSQAAPLPSILGNARVLFNGVPGSLLFVSGRQINVIVPYGLEPDEFVDVRVEYQGERSGAVRLPLRESRFGVFSADGSGQGQAVAWNEDGSFNSAANPAHPGSLLTFYATGGPLKGQATEATPVQAPAPPVSASVSVAFSQPYPDEAWIWSDTRVYTLTPLSVRGVAGSVSGLIEIKVRLPDWDLGIAGPWCVQVLSEDGSVASSLATISVAKR